MAIRYRIDLGDSSRRLIRVRAEFTRAELPVVGESLELVLPTWTPGSYLVREFARHLDRFGARDGSGETLSWRKSAKNTYRIALSAGVERVVAEYEVYAHDLSVRTSCAGEDYVFWNGATTYLWPRGAEDRPATVEVVGAPDGWSLRTAARTTRTESGWHIALGDLDHAVDSPCLVGEIEEFAFETGGRPHRFVAAGLGSMRMPAGLAGDVQKVVTAAHAVFGGDLPYERYEFLSVFSERARGGLEHRDSCLLLSPRTALAKRKTYREFLSLVAHEHFHTWNVTRMRPTELWRVDYEQENYTELLWVAEGFTAYYDDLLCLRAGITSPGEYLEVLRDHVGKYLGNPGRFAQSLAESSFDAWIRLYRPDANTVNSTQNYYGNGALAALCIDAAIRDATDGERSLDDAMRALFRSTFEADRGYTHGDVLAAIDEAAGRELGAMVDEVVHGRGFDARLDAALATFGLMIARSTEAHPFLGLDCGGDRLVVRTVRRGTPAWHAGLAAGDELLAIADHRVTGDSWEQVFEAVAEPDEPIELLIARDGAIYRKEVVPTRHPLRGLAIQAEPTASERAIELREGWLGAAL